MYLSFIKVFNIVLLSIFLLAFALITIALIRTVLFKNNKIKVLEKTSLSSEKINEYQENIEFLFTNELFSAIESLFPTITSKCEKVNFDHGMLYKYRSNQIETTNILVDVPIESIEPNEIKLSATSANGKNTYNSKSTLYSIFDSLETLLIKEKNLDLNITICVYQKKYTNNDMVVHMFEAGEKYDFAIGEGGNILDPITTGYNSFYAFLGTSVNEKATIKFKTKKIGKGQERIEDFIKELKNEQIFELKIASESIPTIRTISKGMLYGNRFILNNIAWLPTLGRRIVEEELTQLNKAWKTWMNIKEVVEDENGFSVDIDFYISNSETVNDIISLLSKKTIKYSLEYEVIEKDEKSRVVSTHDYYYRKLSSIIENSFQELYVMSYAINENISDRNIDKICESVIRFNPIYYSRDAIIGKDTDNEWVSFSSIDKAINFYEEFFLNFRRK